MSQAWHAVTVLSQGIKARITKYEMVLGTGQMLQLDASPSQDLDRSPGTLQVMHMSKYTELKKIRYYRGLVCCERSFSVDCWCSYVIFNNFSCRIDNPKEHLLPPLSSCKFPILFPVVLIKVMELGHLGVLMSYPGGLSTRCLCFPFQFDTFDSVKIMNSLIFIVLMF